MTYDPKDDPDASENDPVLADLGWRGDPMVYRPRMQRMHALALEDRGPLAAMRRDLAAMGYRREQSWPKLNFAWNEDPTPEWIAACARHGRPYHPLPTPTP